MPVLGENDMVEAGSESVDAGKDQIAIGDGQRAPGKEVQLHVDDEKRVSGTELHSCKRTILCKDSGSRVPKLSRAHRTAIRDRERKE